MADNSPLVCRWCTNGFVSFTDYIHFRRHLHVVHNRTSLSNTDLVLFERRPGSIRFVENLPQNYPRNWINRSRQPNAPDQALATRRNRNPFRSQPPNTFNLNIEEVFGAIGESVSMGIERGISAAIRIFAEKDPLTVTQLQQDDSPMSSAARNIPRDMNAGQDEESLLDLEMGKKTPLVVEDIASKEEEENINTRAQDPGVEQCEMISVIEVEKMIRMARAEALAQVGFEEKSIEIGVGPLKKVAQCTENEVPPEMCEELLQNPNFDASERVSKQKPQSTKSNAKVVDLTTSPMVGLSEESDPKPSTSVSKMGRKQSDSVQKELKVMVTRLAPRAQRKNKDEGLRLVFPESYEKN